MLRGCVLRSRLLTTRALTISIIVVLHVILLITFDRSMRGIRRVSDVLVTYMVLIPIAPKRGPVASSAPLNSYGEKATSIIPDVTVNIALPSTNPSDPRPAIDWDAEAKRAAREYLKQHPDQTKPLKDATSPALFDDPTKLPTNIRDPGGKLVQWISSKCYLQIIDGEIGGGPATSGARIQKTCLGAPLTDGHMLDHLKPEYLKKPVEEFCSKTVAGCNENK